MTIREQIIEQLRKGDATCDEIEFRCDIPHQSMGRPLIDLQHEGLICIVGKRKTRRGRREADIFSLRIGNCACGDPLNVHVTQGARQFCARCGAVCSQPIAGVV